MNRLIVFAGLPGTGKSSIARGLAMETGAVRLRIELTAFSASGQSLTLYGHPL
jgi:MoxR-like ATPase